MIVETQKFIVSNCLLGVNCNYKGESRPHLEVIKMFKKGKVIPVCPEQLGGLPTPRPAAERVGDRVITEGGVDVTEQFEKGAMEALKTTHLIEAEYAILKARSPSCGSGEIYDGTFSGNLTEGDGVFAKACKDHGIEVFTEEELSEERVRKILEKGRRTVFVNCIYNDYRQKVLSSLNRPFITPGNIEAVNLLRRKLDEEGINDQSGRLIFEFDPNDRR